MTIPEAAQLVLYASTIGKRGQILMFDMGEPVKIYDLAQNIIKNYTNNDIEINIIDYAPEKNYMKNYYVMGRIRWKQIMNI